MWNSLTDECCIFAVNERKWNVFKDKINIKAKETGLRNEM